MHYMSGLYCIISRPRFFVCPWINKDRRDRASEMKPQPERHPAPLVPVYCITVWKISSPLALVRIPFLRAGISSVASTSLPRHNSPGQHPCASPSAPGANPPAPHCHLQHIWLVYHSGNALLFLPRSQLSWRGARYVSGPATGAVVSSIMSQTSWDAWEHKRERDTERE